MTDYSEYEADDTPAWMGPVWGVAWNYVSGLTKDAWVQAAKEAVKARFAAIAPADALPRLLKDFVLDDPYNETEETVRARLAIAWVTWQRAGTKAGLIAALNAAGYSNVIVQERVTPGRWWEFAVVLKHPFPWDWAGVTLLKIGAGWVIGTTYLSAGTPIGEKERVLALIRKWKPTHAQLTHVMVHLDGPIVGEFSIGDGTILGGTAAYWS